MASGDGKRSGGAAVALAEGAVVVVVAVSSLLLSESSRTDAEDSIPTRSRHRNEDEQTIAARHAVVLVAVVSKQSKVHEWHKQPFVTTTKPLATSSHSQSESHLALTPTEEVHRCHDSGVADGHVKTILGLARTLEEPNLVDLTNTVQSARWSMIRTHDKQKKVHQS